MQIINFIIWSFIVLLFLFSSIRSTLLMYMNNLSLPKEIRDIHKEELKWLDELYDRGLS